MAWARKSLSEHIGIVSGWFEAAVVGGSALMRNSLLSIQARVVAAVLNMFESYLAEEVKNLHTATMDEEHLRQEAADYGIIPNAATYAIGMVTLSGTIGSSIQEGELLQRSDGVMFGLDEDVVLTQTSQLVQVSAIEEGVNGNTIAYAALSFVSPQSGFNSSVIIDEGGITGGADEEDAESLRTRVLERKANPPRGGAEKDYVAWAKQISGVTRVWVQPDWAGAGSVGVQFVFDSRADIFPTTADQARVLSVLLQNAPVTLKTRTYALRPVPKALNISIAISPDTPQIRTDVTAALRSFIQYAASPGGTIFLSQLRATISMVAGESDNRITNLVADIPHQKHEMATLGVITWVPYDN